MQTYGKATIKQHISRLLEKYPSESYIDIPVRVSLKGLDYSDEE